MKEKLTHSNGKLITYLDESQKIIYLTGREGRRSETVRSLQD